MRSIIFCVLFLAALSALAGTQSGKITGYVPYSNGQKEVLLVKLENIDEVERGCNTTARFAMDSDSPKFKATQAAVIAAFHSQTEVKVKYSETCTYAASWDISFICVGNINC